MVDAIVKDGYVPADVAKLARGVLRYGQDYVDAGEQAYEARFAARRLASLKEAARSLGFALVESPQAPEPAS